MVSRNELYKKDHEDFTLYVDEPLLIWDGYLMKDTGDLTYFVDAKGIQTQTKNQILENQTQDHHMTPGWRVLLLQPSVPANPESKGIASIPKKGAGKIQGEYCPRPDVEVGQFSAANISTFLKDQKNSDSPYYGESGMTPEDWIMAFMIHLQETGHPLDDWEKSDQAYLAGAYCPKSLLLCYWNDLIKQVCFKRGVIDYDGNSLGVRFVVVV